MNPKDIVSALNGVPQAICKGPPCDGREGRCAKKRAVERSISKDPLGSYEMTTALYLRFVPGGEESSSRRRSRSMVPATGERKF